MLREWACPSTPAAEVARWYGQKREIEQLRASGLATGVHVHPLQDTPRRLDLAYAAFFRRCAQNARRKGFPRFRGARHWRSFSFQQWGNGVRLHEQAPDGL